MVHSAQQNVPLRYVILTGCFMASPCSPRWRGYSLPGRPLKQQNGTQAGRGWAGIRGSDCCLPRSAAPPSSPPAAPTAGSHRCGKLEGKANRVSRKLWDLITLDHLAHLTHKVQTVGLLRTLRTVLKNGTHLWHWHSWMRCTSAQDSCSCTSASTCTLYRHENITERLPRLH